MTRKRHITHALTGPWKAYAQHFRVNRDAAEDLGVHWVTFYRYANGTINTRKVLPRLRERMEALGIAYDWDAHTAERESMVQKKPQPEEEGE